MGNARVPSIMSRPEKPCFTCGAFPRFGETSYCETHYRENMSLRKKNLRAKRRAERQAGTP
jgi:hypothetical protein